MSTLLIDSNIDHLLESALRLVAKTETMRIKLHIRDTDIRAKREELKWEMMSHAYQNKK